MAVTSNKIRTCISNTYCNIQDNKCLGKPTAKLEEKLAKLMLADWVVGCGTQECEIECFINKNCNC
jgi:hypothetical protein